MAEKVLLSWSGGKDSAMALYEIQRKRQYEVVSLLTSVTQDYDRVTMHGVRRALLELQAESLRLPIEQILISKEASSEEYESRMQAALARFREGGVNSVVFGDVCLEDVRKYREDNLSRIGMKAVFPIWGRNTADLARTFVDLGFKAVVTCVDSRVLGKAFVGRMIDHCFLAELPPNVDQCGENGEYHSFVFDGPIFATNISFAMGETVSRDPFYFCDLVLG